jgi:hypothetical protein
MFLGWSIRNRVSAIEPEPVTEKPAESVNPKADAPSNDPPAEVAPQDASGTEPPQQVAPEDTAANKPLQEATPKSDAAPAPPPEFDYDPQLLELYKKGNLLKPEHYSTLRKLVVERFLREHDEKIRQGLGEDYEVMNQWFKAHPDVFEEFCAAIEEKYDNIAGAFSIFNQIRKKFPETIEKYHNLAIATAVVWDDGSKQSNKFLNMCLKQSRAKYNHRKDADALYNFGYFVENEKYMQGRVLCAPWEVLTYVVYQCTQAGDRKWVLETYGEEQSKLGKAYHQTPYDTGMVESKFRRGKLRGKPYTLPNILSIGGVCTQRSDLCARIAMNLAIPAAAFEGSNDDTKLHAWVAWINLQEVTENSIKFKLKESGRFKNHYYFVGRATAPQHGRRMFGYEFALDFEALTRSVVAKRQTNLAIRVFNWLVKEAELDGAQQIELMEAITDAEPLNRTSWFYLAKVVNRFRGQLEYSERVKAIMPRLTRTFKKYPDVTWRVGTSLIAHFEDIESQREMYEQLAKTFERAKRRDLVCESRLICAQFLVDEKRPIDAIETLADCVSRYPDEGRYIPKLLDKIEAISSATPDSAPRLVEIYKSFLPSYFKAPGVKPAHYSRKVFQRAVKVFSDHGETELVEEATAGFDTYKNKKKKA